MSLSTPLLFTALVCLLSVLSFSHSLRQHRYPPRYYPDDDFTADTQRDDMINTCLAAQVKAVENYVAQMSGAANDDSKVVFGSDFIQRWQESAEDMCPMMVDELKVWDEAFWMEQFEYLLENMNKPPQQEEPEIIVKKTVLTQRQTKFTLKICSSTGDPHITALDKTVNHFTQAGTGLTLFRYRDFVLYADTFGRGLTSAVMLKTEGHLLKFVAGNIVTFDGQAIRISTVPTPLPDGITVKLLGTKYVVASPSGATVEIAKIGTSYFNVYVSVPSDWIGGAEGRCIHKDAAMFTQHKETCVKKCDDDLSADADKNACMAQCDDDVSAKMDTLKTLPWKSEELRQKAEKICGGSLKLEQPYRDFCLEDVKLTNDIDAAQSFMDVKSSLKALTDIDNKEEQGKRAQIFGTLARQLENLKNTQQTIAKLVGEIDAGKLRDVVQKFLVDNKQDIEDLRNVQQEITSEILDEEKE
uniref:VWFD domain-containing protein n=1 Tax=Percolomonas cosmopolitus TaxID=63605 RepID=A0A7S1PKU7_9EUKA